MTIAARRSHVGRWLWQPIDSATNPGQLASGKALALSLIRLGIMAAAGEQVKR